MTVEATLRVIHHPASPGFGPLVEYRLVQALVKH
jgi:hypothetical protein